MPLIKNGRIADEDWAFAEDDAALGDGQVSVTLARFKAERDDLLGRNVPLGVRLSPDDDPHDLADDLERLSLIEVSFPKYADFPKIRRWTWLFAGTAFASSVGL